MALGLIKNGFSEQLAFNGDPPKYLTSVEKWAWHIVFGELDGGTWDYQNHKWADPSENR